MSIRSKLAWTFILLLIFGITAISSYSILFIRNYLLEEGVNQIKNDSRLLDITIRNLESDDRFETLLNDVAVASGYRLAVYDSDGVLLAAVPFHLESEAPPELPPTIQNYLAFSDTLITEETEDPDLLLAYSRLAPLPGQPAESPGSNPGSSLNNGNSGLTAGGGESVSTLPAQTVPAGSFLLVSQLKDQIYAPIKTIRWIIYTGMFISIGLVFLVSIWFSTYMSRPILQLEKTAKKIARGDVSETLQLNRSDEFGTLATSLNQMASRLRSDNEQLKRLYERQGQFFADITHELRNPLHTIAGSLEMLQMENLPDNQKRHYLQTAVKQTDRINRLFKDLVVLQRYDSDQYFLEKNEFDIASVLIQVYEFNFTAAKAKNIDLDIDTDSFHVYADPGKIEQVLDNLISNAIKYTNEGSIAIQFQKKEKDLLITVRDTGIGIPPEHIDKLFDRFYRTDKARSRDSGGTGLGLSVVKSILDAHESIIKVESEVGRGTEITFSLPLADHQSPLSDHR